MGVVHIVMGRSRILDLGGHVLTSGQSVVDKWPKTLYNVGGLGEGHGPLAPPLDPPLVEG